MKASVHHTRKIFFAAAAFCFCYVLSCTKTGNVTLPPYEPRLVLHGYTAVGDTFKIALGKTMPQDELAPAEKTYVNNGWALLYESDVFLDSLKYNAAESRYVSSHVIAASGRIYKIKAGAPGFPAIEAVTVAPFPVGIASINRIKYTRRTTGGVLLDDVKFSFHDPANEQNFYLAGIYGPNGMSCVYTYDPAVERYTVSAVPLEQGICIDNDRILYTDRSFNGSLKEITLSTYSNSLDSFVDPSTGAVYRSYLKKYNITEEYYRYFKTAANQDDVFEEGPFLTTEPRTAKGNVKNGYGLFTVYAVSTDTIR